MMKSSLIKRIAFAAMSLCGWRFLRRSARTIRLEDLALSMPRTDADILKAYRAGRIAEMTPHQAGL